MPCSRTQKGTTLTSILHKHTLQRSLVPIAALFIFALSFLVDLNITSARDAAEQANVTGLTTPTITLVSKASVENEWLPSNLGPSPLGATIQVTTTSQAIGGDGFCSLPEAIYAANFDSSTAISSTNPDAFIFTECTAGSGDDTIVLPNGGVFTMSSIYDPSGGYTIGGGWVPIAPGSSSVDPSLGGKLGFGFNSKYTNATNPKGSALIRFALGNLEFNSLNYDYLSISGGKAQFRGFGKINGEAGYSFILTVIDGNIKGGDGIDRFRIKIWNKATGAIVLDSEPGASDAANPVTPVGLGSSISVKK